MNISKFSPTAAKPLDQNADGVDLRQVISAFRRRLRLFISVALIIFFAVAIYTYRQTPRYTATSTVMIDTRTHQVSGIQDVLSGLPDDTGVIDTEAEILQSRSLAERVVTTLGLDNDPEFNTALRPVNPFLAAINAQIAAIRTSIKGGGAPLSDAAKLRNAAIERTEIHEAVVDQLLSDLSVKRAGLTYVIDIAVQCEDPAKAALIANTVADKYLLEQMEAKYEATQQATLWLNQRLAELQPQVEQAETAVQQYKAAHGLLASVGSSLTEQEISNLNTQLDQAKADLAEKDARMNTALAEADTGSTGENLSGPLNSTTVSQLRTQQAEASSKVADLETRYGARHPEVQRAQRELADINAQIAAEMGRQVSNLQNEDAVARQRVASLEASLSGAKGTLVGNNEASVVLDDLQRRATAASTLYDSLLNRAKQISAEQGNEQSDARVVSHAKIPNAPSYPKKIINLAIGILLGLAGGVGSIFLMEALDSGVNTSDDVERLFNLPNLGSVLLLSSTTANKTLGAQPAQYVVDKPLSAFSEAFRNLRAAILFSKVDVAVKVVALTSALPGEGKTTTATCLGKSMAMSGAKVVVVDCDLRRGAMNHLLGVEPALGLIEILQGAAKLDDVLIYDEASGAWFLPLAKSVYTPKDLFGSHAMDRLLEELRQRFDYVLLDTAPVIPVSDTRILAPKADVVVLLARWRKTPRKAIESALSILSFAGADVAGIALTLVDADEQSRNGYGDIGYYYSAYRKYYTQ